MEVNGA